MFIQQSRRDAAVHTPNDPMLEPSIDRYDPPTVYGNLEALYTRESGFCPGVWMTKSVVVNRHTVDLVYLDSPSLEPNSLSV